MLIPRRNVTLILGIIVTGLFIWVLAWPDPTLALPPPPESTSSSNKKDKDLGALNDTPLPQTGAFVGIGAGDTVTGFDRDGQLVDHWSGVLVVDFGGQSAGTFCIDLTHYILYETRVQATGQTLDCRINWIVHNYPPALSGLSNTETAARQAAIWHFSDGFRPVTDTVVGGRAWEIIDEVNTLTEDGANPGLACDALWPDPPTLTLSPANATQPAGTPVEFTVTAQQGGWPLADLTINLSASSGSFTQTTLTTNVDGLATVTLTSAISGQAHIVAQASYTLPVGVIFEGLDVEMQKLVLGQPTFANIFAEANVTWQDVGDITAHIFHDRDFSGAQGDLSIEENLTGVTYCKIVRAIC